MDKRILVVDFGSDAEPLQRALREQGLDPLRVRDEEEMLAAWQVPPDAVLVAIDAAEDRYRDVVRSVRRSENGQVPILFYGSGQDEAPIRAPSEALAHGGDYFFRLPCDLSYLAGRARAWAERGARVEPEASAPITTPEAPELEGFEAAREAMRLPTLERLRSTEPSLKDPPPDWSWVEELDRSELRGAIEMDLEDPFSEGTHFELGDDILPSEPVPSTRGVSGVGNDEQAALLARTEEEDPLEGLNIEEAEEVEALATSTPLARIEPSRMEEQERAPVWPEVDSTPFDEPPHRPESGPIWMADQAPTVEHEALLLDEVVPAPRRPPAPPLPLTPLSGTRPTVKSDPPPGRVIEPAAGPGEAASLGAGAAVGPAASGAIGPAAPRRPDQPTQVEFPTVDSPERVVTGLRRPQRTRISDRTLEALRALLEGQDPPPEGAAPSHLRASDGPEAAPSDSAPSAPEEEPLPSESSAPAEVDRVDSYPDWTHEEAEENPFEANEPTLTLMPEEREVWTESLLAESQEPEPLVLAAHPPEAPIDDEEDTQELLLAPIAAAAAKDDFPPGALAIVHQAERQQRRGAIAEACSGFALAAQIYIDNAMPEPARALYRQILKIDPEHPFAEDRLAGLEGAKGSGRGSEDYVLEFTEDPPVEPGPDMASDLELAPSVHDAHADLRLPAEPPPEVADQRAIRSRDDERSPSGPTLGRLRGSSLSPETGEAASIADLVQVFLRARAQRTTGLLHMGEAPALVLAHGVPSGLRGDTVLASFLRLVADLGRIGEGQARELVRGRWASPRAVARRLAMRGLIDPEEEILLPSRHLEDHLVRTLQHRGPWRFETTEEVRTDDLVPRIDDLREWLVELLPRASSVRELRDVLGLEGRTVCIVPGTDHFVGPSDLPLVNLLDGRRSLEEAARQAGLPVSRAYAWALVWLQEGLAEKVERAAPIEAPKPHREGPSRGPSVRDLPSLRPRSPMRTSGFRIERRGAETGGRFTLGGDLELPASPPEADSEPCASVHDEGPATGSVDVDRDTLLASLDEEARLQALAEVVRTQDYFGILDVDATASKKTIDDAHRRMRQLVPENIEGDLEAMVREVLRSVDEARDVLMIPELRAAYEHHLEPRP